MSFFFGSGKKLHKHAQIKAYKVSLCRLNLSISISISFFYSKADVV
jgi:hypothetical protein